MPPTGALGVIVKNVDYNNATNLVGRQCTWCHRHTPAKYLAPILVSWPKRLMKHRELHNVCCECIAANNVPKGVAVEPLPQYNHQEKRVNPNEKVLVSLAGLTVPR